MEPYKPTTTFYPIIAVVHMVQTTDIILSPSYQRDIVWNLDNKANFIISCTMGIIPNSLIFNSDKNKKICIDGKQRITALVEFTNNEFAICINNVYKYYTLLPKKYKNDNDWGIMTSDEKNNFDNMNLFVITYENLSYEQQINVFNRIQFGKCLTNGELVSACFINDDVASIFNAFCSTKSKLFKKYCNDDKNRKEYRIWIAKIMYVISEDNPKNPTKKERENYLRSIDTEQKIKKETLACSGLIDFCFGNDLFLNKSNKIIYLNVLFAVILSLYRSYKSKLDSITDKQISILKNAIINTHTEIKEKSLQKMDGTDITDLFKKHKKKLMEQVDTHKRIKITIDL